MFTGIIEGKGRLLEKRKLGNSGTRLVFASDFPLDEPCVGESIAVNGVCLTACEIYVKRFSADVSPESLNRSNLGMLSPGDEVNLERALRLGDRLGGHLVSGHVDSTARLISRVKDGEFTIFSFSLPPMLSRYLVDKGSIAVNGISLTVSQLKDDSFSVSLIPHSLNNTTLAKIKPGELVNLEVDMLGKYVERLIKPMIAESVPNSSRISRDFLAQHGFG